MWGTGRGSSPGGVGRGSSPGGVGRRSSRASIDGQDPPADAPNAAMAARMAFANAYDTSAPSAPGPSSFFDVYNAAPGQSSMRGEREDAMYIAQQHQYQRAREIEFLRAQAFQNEARSRLFEHAARSNQTNDGHPLFDVLRARHAAGAPEHHQVRDYERTRMQLELMREMQQREARIGAERSRRQQEAHANVIAKQQGVNATNVHRGWDREQSHEQSRNGQQMTELIPGQQQRARSEDKLTMQANGIWESIPRKTGEKRIDAAKAPEKHRHGNKQEIRTSASSSGEPRWSVSRNNGCEERTTVASGGMANWGQLRPDSNLPNPEERAPPRKHSSANHNSNMDSRQKSLKPDDRNYFKRNAMDVTAQIQKPNTRAESSSQSFQATVDMQTNQDGWGRGMSGPGASTKTHASAEKLNPGSEPISMPVELQLDQEDNWSRDPSGPAMNSSPTPFRMQNGMPPNQQQERPHSVTNPSYFAKKPPNSSSQANSGPDSFLAPAESNWPHPKGDSAAVSGKASNSCKEPNPVHQQFPMHRGTLPRQEEKVSHALTDSAAVNKNTQKAGKKTSPALQSYPLAAAPPNHETIWPSAATGPVAGETSLTSSEKRSPHFKPPAATPGMHFRQVEGWSPEDSNSDAANNKFPLNVKKPNSASEQGSTKPGMFLNQEENWSHMAADTGRVNKLPAPQTNVNLVSQSFLIRQDSAHKSNNEDWSHSIIDSTAGRIRAAAAPDQSTVEQLIPQTQTYPHRGRSWSFAKSNSITAEKKKSPDETISPVSHLSSLPPETISHPNKAWAPASSVITDHVTAEKMRQTKGVRPEGEPRRYEGCTPENKALQDNFSTPKEEERDAILSSSNDNIIATPFPLIDKRTLSQDKDKGIKDTPSVSNVPEKYNSGAAISFPGSDNESENDAPAALNQKVTDSPRAPPAKRDADSKKKKKKKKHNSCLEGDLVKTSSKVKSAPLTPMSDNPDLSLKKRKITPSSKVKESLGLAAEDASPMGTKVKKSKKSPAGSPSVIVPGKKKMPTSSVTSVGSSGSGAGLKKHGILSSVMKRAPGIPSIDDFVSPITQAEFENAEAMMTTFCKVPFLAEFSRPVSLLHPELMELYSKIVHRPMDLGHVCRCIRRREYKDTRAIQIDVWRIFSNCVKFHTHPNNRDNAIPSFISIAMHLREFFNSLWQEYMMPSDAPPRAPGKGISSVHAAFQKRAEARKERLLQVSSTVLSTKCLRRLILSLEEFISSGGRVDKLDKDAILGDVESATGDISVFVQSLRRVMNDIQSTAEANQDYSVFALHRDLKKCYTEDVFENNILKKMHIGSRLDRILGKTLVPIHEVSSRGVNQSSVWGCMAAAIWARESRKKPFWPAIVLGILAPDDQKEDWHQALTDRNEARLPEKLREELKVGKRKAEQGLKKQSADLMSYFLVEFMGSHEFIWVRESDIIENFDPEDDPNVAAAAGNITKKKRSTASSFSSKAMSNAIEEGRWALEEFELQLNDTCGDQSDDEGDYEDAGYTYDMLCQSDDEADEMESMLVIENADKSQESDLDEQNELLASDGLLDFSAEGRKKAKARAAALKKHYALLLKKEKEREREKEKESKAKKETPIKKKKIVKKAIISPKETKKLERHLVLEEKREKRALELRRKKRLRDHDKLLKESERKSKRNKGNTLDRRGRSNEIHDKRSRAEAVVRAFLIRKWTNEEIKDAGFNGALFQPTTCVDPSGLLGMALSFRAAAGEIPFVDSNGKPFVMKSWEKIDADSPLKSSDRCKLLQEQIDLIEEEIMKVNALTERKAALLNSAEKTRFAAHMRILNAEEKARVTNMRKKKKNAKKTENNSKPDIVTSFEKDDDHDSVIDQVDIDEGSPSNCDPILSAITTPDKRVNQKHQIASLDIKSKEHLGATIMGECEYST